MQFGSAGCVLLVHRVWILVKLLGSFFGTAGFLNFVASLCRFWGCCSFRLELKLFAHRVLVIFCLIVYRVLEAFWLFWSCKLDAIFRLV